MSNTKNESNTIYLIVCTDKKTKWRTFDLFPSSKDTLLSLKHKLTKGYELDSEVEPAWTTSEISVYKVTKDQINENFDTLFGEPEVSNNCSSWFDVSLPANLIKTFKSCKLDVGRFILENANFD